MKDQNSTESQIEELSENFSLVVKQNYKNVYSLANRIVKNQQDAEDITQEVFMKYYNSASSFRNESKLSTLLYRITYNLSIDYLRKRRPSCDLDETIYEASPDYCADEDHKVTGLLLAIKELPLEDQLIVTLYYMDKKSIEEVSKITSLSLSNVKIKLFRIRKKLHEKLGESYEQES